MRFLKQPLKCALLLFCLLGSLFVKASDISNELKQLAEEWNSLHNTRDIKAFQELYAGQVLFYGKYKKGSYCADRKAKFLNEDFSQKIISPITVQFYSSGTTKCSFTKEVTYKEKAKTHQCYLLFKEENGRYHITGESDLQTDQNLKVQLDLGTELSSPVGVGHTGSYILISLLVIIGVGAFVIYKKRAAERAKREELSQFYVSASETTSAALAEPFITSVGVVQQNTNKEATVVQTATIGVTPVLTGKEKGDAFENYILSLFDRESKRFRLLEWRSDKITKDGLYAQSNHLPDLVLDFHANDRYHKFAIECKWRSNFQNGTIDWAKEYQIKNYLTYEKKEKVPVFVVIGVGGSPDDPEQMFVVPLKKINKYSSLFESTLKQYSRSPKHKFYYNFKERTLR